MTIIGIRACRYTFFGFLQNRRCFVIDDLYGGCCLLNCRATRGGDCDATRGGRGEWVACRVAGGVSSEATRAGGGVWVVSRVARGVLSEATRAGGGVWVVSRVARGVLSEATRAGEGASEVSRVVHPTARRAGQEALCAHFLRSKSRPGIMLIVIELAHDVRGTQWSSEFLCLYTLY